jgi:hypothetical protein
MRTPNEDIERPIAVVLMMGALLPVLFIGYAYWRDNGLARGFDKITVGATQRDVVRLMGKPKKIEKCGEFFGPIPQSEMKGCASEYLYAVTVAPYVPSYYVIRFDEGGRVLSTDPYSSP